MPHVQCLRCGETRDGLPAPPFNNDIGRRVHEAVCGPCWQDWLRHQTALINHYALNVRDPQAKQFLFQQLEAYLFGGAHGP